MIRTGEVHKVETKAQFKDALDVTWDEIIPCLSEEQQEEICYYENEHRRDVDRQEISDPADAHEDILSESLDEINEHDLIETVLRTRSREYVHLYDGYIHTIVDLFPPHHHDGDECWFCND